LKSCFRAVKVEATGPNQVTGNRIEGVKTEAIRGRPFPGVALLDLAPARKSCSRDHSILINHSAFK